MSAVAQSLIQSLPDVRGRYSENGTLGEKGWFRCGGTADVVFKPADKDDLIAFLQNCPADIPIHIFGALSNTIIRDGGLRGVVIRFGREFADIKVDGDKVIAGALALDANVAAITAEHGLAGLEFFSGIPGTIGGAVKMNAGCYGTEIKDVLIEATIIDRQGNVKTCTPEQLGMLYRHTNVTDQDIVIEAIFSVSHETVSVVKDRISRIKEQREASQPIREKTGGSTFANPSAAELSLAGLSDDIKVWQLIDQVGGRGLKIGGALMSEKHCNFMINTGNATAADLEALGEEVCKRVAEAYGITLRWEIRRIGEV